MYSNPCIHLRKHNFLCKCLSLRITVNFNKNMFTHRRTHTLTHTQTMTQTHKHLIYLNQFTNTIKQHDMISFEQTLKILILILFIDKNEKYHKMNSNNLHLTELTFFPFDFINKLNVYFQIFYKLPYSKFFCVQVLNYACFNARQTPRQNSQFIFHYIHIHYMYNISILLIMAKN